MLNKKIKALETIIAGLTLYAEAMRECETCNCNSETPVVAPTAHSATPVTTTETEDTETDDEQEDDTQSTANYTVEELSEMSYNDLKKLAASLNIKAVGSRKALVDAVMSAIGVSNDDTADEPDEDEPVSETADDDAEPEDDDSDSAETDDDEDDEEDDEPTTEQLVLEATEDMTDDELRDLLESVDVSGKGKRQSLIAKLVTAVEKGLISLSDEEGDEEPDDEDTADADDTTDDEPETDEQSDEPFGDVTAGMSKKRRAAFDDLCDTTQDSFTNGEITRDDLTEFLMQFDEDNSKKSLSKLSDEDLIVKYLSACALLVSDAGEVVEEGAYTIDDVPYCCGRPLNYNKKTGNYKCSCCGAEYESE